MDIERERLINQWIPLVETVQDFLLIKIGRPFSLLLCLFIRVFLELLCQFHTGFTDSLICFVLIGTESLGCDTSPDHLAGFAIDNVYNQCADLITLR